MNQLKIRSMSPLVSGTIILTLTGIVTRMIGFFYRIFLSRCFGEEGMGIYQLIAPVLALSFSFCVAGIQTAISKYVAMRKNANHTQYTFQILLSGTGLSLILSIFFMYITYQYADTIACHILLEKRCAPLLRIIALSIPFASLHSCINGYFYGMKHAAVPAATQLIEQIIRVGSVYLLLFHAQKTHSTLTISCAVIGLVIGEICSMMISLFAVYIRFFPQRNQLQIPSMKIYCKSCKEIFSLALPLSANRIVLNILQSMEAIQIPNSLLKYGLTNSAALSIYGVLTGMALPLILFPSALTNSLAVMLLPTISEADGIGDRKAIRHTVSKTLRYCIMLGVTCTAGFLFFGNIMGTFLFHNNSVGSFIQTLSFLCPFLYLSTTMGSILHGLGKTRITFCYSCISLAIRLFFVFSMIPVLGMKGYLYGLLISQLVLTGLLYASLHQLKII